MVGGGRPPVICLPGLPVECAMGEKGDQRLVGIGAHIRCEAELRPRFHDAGKSIQERRLDDAALVVAFLRPGVWKQDKDPVETVARQQVDKVARILIPEPHIREAHIVDVREAFGEPFDKDFAGDNPGLRIGLRLRADMLPPAKTDLQPQLADLIFKEVQRGFERPRVRREPQAGQKVVHKALLAARQGTTALAAEGPDWLTGIFISGHSIETFPAARRGRSMANHFSIKVWPYRPINAAASNTVRPARMHHTAPPPAETTGLVSLVIPVLNEEESVERLHAEICDAFQDLPHDFEVIFVDDGSTDDTPGRLVTLCGRNQNVRLVRFRRNFGKAAALDAGFAVASGDIIFTMDADLQDDPAEIPNFIAALEGGLDVVSGWKHKRHDPLDKTLPSKLFNRVVGKLSGVRLNDFNCGFKAYRAEALNGLNLYGELHRFIPVLLHWRGFAIGEIPVNHRARQFGKSKYGFGRLFKGGLDFLGVMLNTRYATRPLHVFGGAAFLLGGIGFAILAYLSVLWAIGAGPIGNRPLLLLGILMVMTSFQFITIGLLGEFIQHQGASRQVRYQVRETANLGAAPAPTPQLVENLNRAAAIMKEAETAWTRQRSDTTQASGTPENTPTRTRSTG